jgi:hypothetical protein
MGQHSSELLCGLLDGLVAFVITPEKFLFKATRRAFKSLTFLPVLWLTTYAESIVATFHADNRWKQSCVLEAEPGHAPVSRAFQRVSVQFPTDQLNREGFCLRSGFLGDTVWAAIET